MNSANALGFFVVGVAMWALPLIAPGVFPPTAIDGSSTRAIWMQLMGLVQAVLGLSYLISGYARMWLTTPEVPVVRGATATADWQGDTVPLPVLAVNVSTPGAPTASPAPSLPLRQITTGPGDTAALWQAFHEALLADANLRQLAHRALLRMHPLAAAAPHLALVETPPEPDPLAILPFIWRDEEELAEKSAA